MPTEVSLKQSRSERDAVWQLLRRQWIGSEDVSVERVNTRVKAHCLMPSKIALQVPMRYPIDCAVKQTGFMRWQSLHAKQEEAAASSEVSRAA